MDIRKVKKLIELVKATDIAELEIHEGEESVRIAHNKPVSNIEYHTIPTPKQNQAQNAVPTLPEEKPKEHRHMVKAPMVGTVYLSSSPDAKPFVEAGQKVKVGDTLCIIEAMKMFNQVEADKAGTISACLIENAHPVEFDQPLFAIEEN
jgi:acetyl-CoA carboxylase biotin carboxyl carrier protein